MPEAALQPPPPWERGQGHDGRPERPTTHARFRAWLELGSSRNLAAYAAALGVTKQSLSETAARFNWRRGRGGMGCRRGPLPPPPPQRPKMVLRPTTPPKPKPAPPPSPNPTANGAATGAAGSRAFDAHLLALSQNRLVMEQLGRGMAEEAEGALRLITLLTEHLVVEIARRRLATTGDHVATAEASQGAAQIVVMISWLVALVTTMGAESRKLWDDSIGEHRILEEAFAVRKGKQSAKENRPGKLVRLSPNSFAQSKAERSYMPNGRKMLADLLPLGYPSRSWDMADNSRYSNWRRRDQTYREGQARDKELRLSKEIAKEAFEWETLTAAKEKNSGSSSHKTLILEAYKIALKDAVGRSQCDKVFEIFSFGNLALIHDPAISSFVLIETYVNPIVHTGSGEPGWAKFEVSWGVEYFQFGDGFSELLTIELALLHAMIAYLNQGGALSQGLQGTRPSSGSSFLTPFEIYN